MPENARPTGLEMQSGWLAELASPRWTIVFFLLTAATALAVVQQAGTPTLLMAPPFLLLLTNLGAAILVRPRFRADFPLLLLHLTLVAFMALVVVARLTYLHGTITLSNGSVFEGKPDTEERGPLHRGKLGEIRFANDGFTENFTDGRPHATYNRVSWQDDAGRWHVAQIGDDYPLLIKGYKVFTTRHRGFSPLFLWRPSAGGAEEYGAVPLAEQPEGVIEPATSFTLPNGSDAWLMLDLETKPALTDKPRADLGSKDLVHRLVLRTGGQRHVLRPGDHLALAEGNLIYVRLDSWMGYVISHDPTKPWMIATLLIGIGSLIWFYWRRLRADTVPTGGAADATRELQNE